MRRSISEASPKILDMIRMLGAMVDAAERARQLVGTLETRLAEVRSRAARLPKHPRVFLHAIWVPVGLGVIAAGAASLV
jgi:ABC-type Fe3+-hydroxamate transport system substrate-binding protein